MKAAPPFDCAMCNKRIGKERTHWQIKNRPGLICAACLDKHDLYNDIECSGTRAGMAAVRGLWPHEFTDAELERAGQALATIGRTNITVRQAALLIRNAETTPKAVRIHTG